MPKIRPEVRSQRRDALIDAAWRCAARRGFRDLTVDDVCAEAGVSKGAFYGYFKQKRDLLLALLEHDEATVDGALEQITAASTSGTERVRRLALVMLSRGEDAGRVQVRTDLWSELLTDSSVQRLLAETTGRRRTLVRSWIEEGVKNGELVRIPSNALASILLALADGLTLHRALDPEGFQWRNIRRAIDMLLAGIEAA